MNRRRDLAKVGLLLLFVLLTNRGVAGRVAELVGRGEWVALAAFALIWVVALAALGTVAFYPGRAVRVGGALVVAGSTFIGDYAYSVIGSHLTFFDLLLMWAERARWGDALEHYSSVALGPLLRATLGAVALGLAPARALPWRGLAWVGLAPIVLICALLAALGGRGTRALPEQFAPLSMGAALVALQPFDEQDHTRAPVSGTPVGPRWADDVFLIVDESVRADYVDLNLDRSVTPFLRSQAERIANFGYAVAGNNCSLFANLMLRYGGTRHTVTETLRSGPSIWAFARAAGMETVYVDGQLHAGRLHNGMTVIERREIDRLAQFGDLAAAERSSAVAALLVELATDARPQFALVNTSGSHFPYSRNYPREAARFQPDMEPGEPIGANRERLLNSYANSVAWHTDRLFRELLGRDLGSALILYTSDHGQSLMDRGLATHCNTSNPHVLEGIVPLLATTGDAELLARMRTAGRRLHNRVDHARIFPTLLRAFGYTREQIDVRYGPDLLNVEAPTAERAFSFGPVIGLGATPRWRDVTGTPREWGVTSAHR